MPCCSSSTRASMIGDVTLGIARAESTFPILVNIPHAGRRSVRAVTRHCIHPPTAAEGDSGTPGVSESPQATATEPLDQSSVVTLVRPKEGADPTRPTLAGRIGRPPSVRATKNGTPIASPRSRFEAGATTWHTVLAVNERAERMRDHLVYGQFVEVSGSRRRRERRSLDGSTRLVEAIAATVVKPR